VVSQKSRQPRRNATRRPPHLHQVPAAAEQRAPESDEAFPPSDEALQAPDEDFQAPDEIVAPIAESLIAEMGRVRRALDAELLLGQVFGTVQQGIVGDAAERDFALASLLGQVTRHAEHRSTPDALALLRVLAVLGPARSRAGAEAAAVRLARLGVADQPWAAGVGRPDVLQSWQYGDIVGEQESLAVLFSYRRHHHVLTVLIDHALGGGVKDCWIGVGKRAAGLREYTANTLGSDPEIWLRDVDVVVAASVLRRALSLETVAGDDEQVQDVATMFHVTFSRAEHLCGLAGLRAPTVPW
jgi:hypothetical protein